MADFFEIDFLGVETKKSGDAISVRYEINGQTYIHVVDGGYQATGEKMVRHIKAHYGNPDFINHVVVTHQDGDHAAGLPEVLRSFRVGALWMLRPWIYAPEIIHRFATYNSVDRLRSRLRSLFPYLAALEDVANELGIPIYEPFQGAQIGAFTCLSPSKATYFDLVVESDKTPEHIEEGALASAAETFLGKASELMEKVVAFVAAAWGFEAFSPNETSNENEMSVVQFANLCGKKVLLTGDAGRRSLGEAADYAPMAGLALPGIDRFQVPHHGSRRNVSTDLLDRWLGERLGVKPEKGQGTFTAIVSAAEADSHHPRRSVVRAMIHRGADIVSTETGDKRTGYNAPARPNWVAAPYLDYPHDVEE